MNRTVAAKTHRKPLETPAQESSLVIIIITITIIITIVKIVAIVIILAVRGVRGPGLGLQGFNFSHREIFTVRSADCRSSTMQILQNSTAPLQKGP